MAIIPLCPHMAEGTWELSGISFIEVPILSTNHGLITPPKSLPPDTITLRIGFKIGILEGQKYSVLGRCSQRKELGSGLGFLSHVSSLKDPDSSRARTNAQVS